MKQVKRIVAILLCAVMMVTALPMTAKAEEVTPEWEVISGLENIAISINPITHRIVVLEDSYKDLNTYLNTLIASKIQGESHLYYQIDEPETHQYCMFCGVNIETPDGEKDDEKIIDHQITIYRKSDEPFNHYIDCSCTKNGDGEYCPFSRVLSDCDYEEANSCSICGAACVHEWQDEGGNFNDGKCYKCDYVCEHGSLDWDKEISGESVKHIKYCVDSECNAVWASHEVSETSWGDWKKASGDEAESKHYRECQEDDCTIRDEADHSYEEPLTNKCKTCGYIKDHTPAWDVKTGTCKTCGEVCEHSYDEPLTNKCKTCGYIKDHTPNWDAKTGICKTCGEVCEHSYDELLINKCKTCGYIKDHTPDWDAETGTCKTCGEECDHDWESETGICAVCGKTCVHSYEEPLTNKCKTCGYIKDHTPDWDDKTGTCKTCGEECEHVEWNAKTGACIECGFKCTHDNKTSKPIRYISDNCTKGGSQEWTCDDCGFSGKETIDPKTHKFGTDTKCENVGCTVVCSHPSAQLEWKFSENKHNQVCKDCGSIVKSHNATMKSGTGVSKNSTYHEGECASKNDCGLKVSGNHTFNTKTPIVIEATCSQNGIEKVSCDDCNYVKVTTIDKVGHSGGTENVTYTDNDCTKGGKRSYDACKWCKASYEETITPYSSHNIVNGKCTRCEKAEIKLEEGDGKVGSKKYELVDSLSASTKQYILDHLSDVFTDTEIASLNSGSTLTIYGVAKTYSSDSLSTAKRKAFKEELSEGYAIAQYYDISLYGKVGKGTGKKVQPGTGNYVSVTLPIPSSIKTAKIADNAGFEILHMLEDGTVENLNVDFDEDEKTFSFQTDSFSYFALTYDKDDVKKKATTPVVTLPGIGTGTGGGTGTITLPGGIVIPGYGGTNPAYGGTIDPYWGGNGATYGGVTYQWTFQNGKWGYYPVYDNPFADRFIEIFTSHNPWYAYQSVFERFTTIARNLWGMK